MTTKTFTLLITVNGPGEVSNLLKPLCHRVAKEFSFIDIYVHLVYCQFASGYEYENAKKLPAVSDVFSAKTTFLQALGFRALRPVSHGAVLFLGGDPWYAKALAKRLKLPAYAYAERALGRGFKHVFVRNKYADLMSELPNLIPKVNEKESLKKHNLEPKDYALFFTSSRNKQMRHLVPFYLESIKQIQKFHPNFSALISLSPFVDAKQAALFKKLAPPNVYFVQAPSYDLYPLAKYLVTIPGTNTAEAMYAQKPMLVVLPLIKPEVLDFPGTLGLLMRIPVLNTLLLKLVVAYFKKKIPYFSIPNILIDSKPVPELVGNIYPKDVATFIKEYLAVPSKFNQQLQQFHKLKSKQSIVSRDILKTMTNLS